MPSSRSNGAAMIVVSRRRSEYSEGAKAVIAFKHRCRLIERSSIKRPVDRVLTWPSKRRPCFFVRTDVVTIAPRDGAVACMKLRTHLEGGSDPYVVGQDRVECASHSHGTPALGKAHTDRLTSRVHAGVGSSGAECRNRRPTPSLECL